MTQNQLIQYLRQKNSDDWERLSPVVDYVRLSSSDDLLFKTLNLLSSPASEFSGDKIPQIMPWNLLLLFKLALALGNQYDLPSNRNSNNQFLRLMQKIGDLYSSSSAALAEFSDLDAFARTMSFQQFSFQTQQLASCIGRNHILFNELPVDQNIESCFRSVFRTTSGEFSDLLCSFIVFMPVKFPVPTIGLSNLEKVYGLGTVKALMGSISMSEYQARRFATESLLETKLRNQFVEESPFRLRPFLRFRGRIYLLHRSFLIQLLSSGHFELMRSLDYSNKFSPAFGKKMERYLSYYLSQQNVDFISESDQKNQFGIDVKVVDFIIGNSERILLIESKAIDLPYKTRTSTSPDALRKAIKSSVIHGIEQCFSVADRIRRDSCFGFGTQAIDIIVVTFSDFYLGPLGGKQWEMVFKEEIDRYCITNGIDPSIVSPWRIHVISIDTFERLFDGRDLQQVFALLDTAQRLNQQKSTAKHSFSLFLTNRNDTPRLLKAASERQFERSVARLRSS